MPALGEKGGDGCILARELNDLGPASMTQGQRQGEIACCILDPHHAFERHQLDHGIELDAGAAAARNIVNQQRQALGGPGNGLEMGGKPGLAGLVVIGADQHAAIGAHRFGLPGQGDAGGGIVRAGGADHRDATARAGDGDAEHLAFLVMGQGWRFARGAGDHQPVAAAV